MTFRYYQLGLFIKYTLKGYEIPSPDNLQQIRYKFCNGLSDIDDDIRIWAEQKSLNVEDLGSWNSVRHSATNQTDVMSFTGLTKEEFTELFSEYETCMLSRSFEDIHE